jgi:hypothetical protein
MTNKWNVAEIKNTSQAFAEVVCEEYFKTKENINGSEIIGLTEIKQLNLFILKELFEKWQIEISNIKSPYFNYSEPEVQKALDDFMNILSRHIHVNSENFKGILETSVKKTIGLFSDPKSFFVEEMRSLTDFKLTADWLTKNGKFFKDYNWVLRELLTKLNGVSFIYANEAIDFINQFFDDNRIEDHTKELSDISKIADEHSPAASANNPYQSFFDSIEEYKMAKPQMIAKESEVDVHAVEVVEKDEPITEMRLTQVQEKIETVITENPVTKTIEKETTVTLHESMQLTSENSSLSDFHQKRKIDSIKGNISLNQKFLFINNLFGSDSNIFNGAIDELENCNSFSEAKDQMIKKYLPKYKWDLNSPEAEEFFDILKRRYN